MGSAGQGPHPHFPLRVVPGFVQEREEILLAHNRYYDMAKKGY